jgi:hypothetical protein
MRKQKSSTNASAAIFFSVVILSLGSDCRSEKDIRVDPRTVLVAAFDQKPF